MFLLFRLFNMIQVNVTFECKLFVVKCWKRCRWVKHNFLEKPSFFKFLSILEENCVADINNESCECNLFVGKCCKTRPLNAKYFPEKPERFQPILNSSIFLKKFLCFESTILRKSIFGPFDGVEFWWGKNSFTNEIVKDNFVFPLFFGRI